MNFLEMKKGAFVKALSMAERREALLPLYRGRLLAVTDHLTEWQARKSLCSRQQFAEALRLQALDPQVFNLGIKELTAADEAVLWQHLQRQPWFLLNQKIFATASDELAEPATFAYALRFHLAYLSRQLKQLVPPDVLFDPQGFRQIATDLESELLALGLKTFVADLHEQKHRRPLTGASAAERFRSYLQERFSTTAAVLAFFADYPVLWRLFAERLQFCLDNVSFFLASLQKSQPALKEIFQVTAPFHLSIDTMAAGDSHQQGKSVILFKLNQQALVFKFKDLRLSRSWHEFLSVVEKASGSAFYHVKRYTAADFCIEEFVEHRSCSSEQELAAYYYRFGEYTALCHFLGGSDFHADNLVACGAQPVIVDIETLLQNSVSLSLPKDVYAKATAIRSQSVLRTGLLPLKYVGRRIGPRTPQSNAEKKGLLISAFNGQRQLLPYKVLQLVDENTDKVRLEYQELFSVAKRNIPLLHGQPADPAAYKDQVVAGFTAQYRFFVANKRFLAARIKALFAEVTVRELLRPTQQYLDLLDYSCHPSCMTDQLEREKLLENLWAFAGCDKRVVPWEYQALLVHDIPLFCNRVSQRSLLVKPQGEVQAYYQQTALERVVEGISRLDEDDLAMQLVWLNSSLERQLNVVRDYEWRSVSKEQQLKQLVDEIVKRAVYDEEAQHVLFFDQVFEGGQPTAGLLALDFYDGLAGLYVFLLAYHHFYPEEQTRKLLAALELRLFKETKQLTSCSVYSGPLSVLPACYYRYLLTGDSAALAKARALAKQIDLNLTKLIWQPDWLAGAAGLVKILLGCYQAAKESCFLTLAEKLAARIKVAEVKLCGLSHGRSGVILALNELRKYSAKPLEIDRQITACLQWEQQHFDGRVWQDLREDLAFTAQWCHGAVGIGWTRLALLQEGFHDPLLADELQACIGAVLSQALKEDCLCHGNMGRLLFLKDAAVAPWLTESCKVWKSKCCSVQHW